MPVQFSRYAGFIDERGVYCSVYVILAKNVNYLHLTGNYDGILYVINIRFSENIENRWGKKRWKYEENIRKGTVTEGRRS